MAVLETHLPADTELPIHSGRVGPVAAAEFDTWAQDADNPYELIAGWVVPMSPGNVKTGKALPRLAALLLAQCDARGWTLLQDARHHLPAPPDTVVFPDLALHCTPEVPVLAGTDTAARVPDLVIELLGEETCERDRAPHGAKFLAYQMSGVREYYYAWPDGREAAGFRLENGVFMPIEPDAEGFFVSSLLGVRLRLAPASALPPARR